MATKRRKMLSRTVRMVPVAWLMATALTGTAVAGPFEDGVTAFNRGDYAQAVKSFRNAAEQGNADALLNLGFMYNRGKGVPQDYAKALVWYRKAAEQGYALAQFNLGLMYHKGEGVKQDNAEAVMWYREAAEQGFADAQINLGLMYSKGGGVPQDFILAHMWSSIAASRYPASEKERRDKAIRNRDTLATRMTPAQIAEAQKLAREWKPKP